MGQNRVVSQLSTDDVDYVCKQMKASYNRLFYVMKMG